MAIDEAKDKSLEPKFSQKYLDFIRDMRSKVRVDINDRMTWRQKMVIAVNQRLGVKRYTSFPYPGAPDIPLPETDKLIKKSIPNLVLSAWSPKKMCRVRVAQGVQETPELIEKAKKSELAMNMFLRSDDMGLFKKLLLAADNRKQYGHCIFKVSEKFICRRNSKSIDLTEMDELELQMFRALLRVEKESYFADKYDLDVEDKEDQKIIADALEQFNSGKDIIEFEIVDYKSIPMIDVVEPINITVPSYTKDIDEAVRIREEFFLPQHIVEQLMADEIFLKKDLKLIPFWTSGDNDQVEYTKSRNEGLQDNTSRTDLYRMEMISCWYREDDSSPFYRKIFTFFADAMDPELALAQDIDFPFNFGGSIYVKDDNEQKIADILRLVVLQSKSAPCRRLWNVALITKLSETRCRTRPCGKS
jgi:hypothetical protein